MKSIFVLLLTLSMLLAFTAVSMAGTISADYFSGCWDDEVEGLEYDNTAVIINLELPFEPFKFSLDYFTGSLEDDSDYTTDSYELKFGYLVTGDDALSLYLNLGYYNFDFFDSYYTFVGYTFSGDLNVLITDNSTFDGSLGLSLSGDWEDPSADAALLYLKLKYTYFFNDSTGLGVGYRYYQHTVDLPTDPAVTISGFTLGVTFRF